MTNDTVFQLDVTAISAVKVRGGVSQMYLTTTLPNGVWPFENSAIVKMEIAHNKLDEYLEANFPGVDVNIIDAT